MKSESRAIFTAIRRSIIACIPVGLIWGCAETWKAYYFTDGYSFSLKAQSGQVFLYLLISLCAGFAGGLILGIFSYLISFLLPRIHSFNPRHYFILAVMILSCLYTLTWWHSDMDPIGGVFEPAGIAASAVITGLLCILTLVFLRVIPRLVPSALLSVRGVILLFMGAVLATGFLSVMSAEDQLETGNAVFLLSIDTLRADHTGCYGYPAVKTPFMDRLSKTGLQFSNCYAQIPGTNPNFASIMTSLYPHEHKVFFNGVPVPADITILPEILRKNEYVTGAFIAASVLKSNVSGLKKGFDVYNEEYSIRDYGLHPLYLFKLFRRFSVRNAGEVNSALYPFLNSCIGKNFFVWLHYYDPHNSYNPPAPFDTMYNPDYTGPVHGESRNANWFNDLAESRKTQSDIDHLISMYNGEITYTDSCLEQLYCFLKRTFGKREQKFVYIFTADHGENMCDHEPRFGHGDLLYNPSLKVPLIVKGPGIDHNVLNTDYVESVDIAPSVLRILNLDIPSVMSGNVIFPPSDQQPKIAVYAENGNKLISIETTDWKCIYSIKEDKLELYSVKTDPGETQDIASIHDEVALQMKDRILAFLGLESNFEPQLPDLDQKTLRELQALGYLTGKKPARSPTTTPTP